MKWMNMKMNEQKKIHLVKLQGERKEERIKYSLFIALCNCSSHSSMLLLHLSGRFYLYVVWIQAANRFVSDWILKITGLD